jgi:signal transduction histidine kinase
LIDNSIKYSKKDNGVIQISLYKDKNIHFIVKDNGIGIPKKDLENIMDRFYRVDESRSKKIKGFGLGLSIVKNSVELHNGAINITSSTHNGTKVEIIL